jgi:NAD-dependent deacetylase
LAAAFAAARACELLFAIGTSGLVQPAARIPVLAMQAGAKVVQVNPTATALDGQCTWSLRGQAGAIMPALLRSAQMVPHPPVRGG